MAQRQTSYAKKGREFLTEANQAKAEADEAERAARRQMDAQRDRRAQQEFAEAVFDALREGDSLECFGVAAVVKRKNAKSVVTNMGTRWTKAELTGVR